jgi:putative NIF3 family GTP cyclohydrolase 1 type 2
VPAFIKTIGLTDPIRSGHVWSFHEQPPISLQELAKRTAAALNMDQLRVTGTPERIVTRVGTMVGGLMQDRHIDAWEKHLMPLGVEVIIGGETNDFAQRFAIDSGIALIETCHSTSEEPGLKILAQDFRTAFDGTKVVFHQEVIPWVTL